nr:exopolygalacturonase-like [Quercus suber]
MGLKLTFGWVCLLILSLSVCITEAQGQTKDFNVKNYGAIADGSTDNSKAFLKAWKEACEWTGRARVWIPIGTYRVNSVKFEGPCKGPIAFVIKGYLKAPTEPSLFITQNWINFRYINNLTVSGGGVLDGQGKEAWTYNDCNKNPNCPSLPTTMRFDFVTNAWVHHLRSINSKNTHFVVFGCVEVKFTNTRISAPADSPNTDGIKMANSRGIKIQQTTIRTGDDCIAMLAGTRHVRIFNVTCGPGHGISIGSLGKDGDQNDLFDIRVRNCSFHNTSDGIRIKTWASPGIGKVSALIYEDIFMNQVGNPIIIDQEYCPYPPCKTQPSRVQISNVTYRNIWGYSGSKVAVTFRCSQSTPCRDLVMENINLHYHGRDGEGSTALCNNVKGESLGPQNPASCI